MLNELYNGIAIFMIGSAAIGVILGVNRGLLKMRKPVQPDIQKYTVEVEISDPMLVAEIQTLKQLQDVYNAQISQQSAKHEIFGIKYDRILKQIDDQRNEMMSTSHLDSKGINSKLYNEKIAELSEIRNGLMGDMLKTREKIIKLTKQSDDITVKLNNIARKEYERQNQ